MLASLLRIILLTATLKILERGLDKGPIIKNGPNSYTKINDSLQKLAGKRPLDEKGKFIKEYCELLEFFGEVYVLDSDEFRNQIEDYALPPL